MTPYHLSAMPSEPIQRFERQVKCLLQPHDLQGRALFGFIRLKLHQFSLSEKYSDGEIFHEAYLRSIAAIQAGTDVQIPVAWLRRTAYNVIREFARKHQRQPTQEWDQWSEMYQSRIEGRCACNPQSELSLLELEEEVRSLRQVLSQLSLAERRLIWLRYTHNLSWRAIADYLIRQGELDTSEVTLRKQGQRAIDKLRKLYR